jgi:hypothetical protein
MYSTYISLYGNFLGYAVGIFQSNSNGTMSILDVKYSNFVSNNDINSTIYSYLNPQSDSIINTDKIKASAIIINPDCGANKIISRYYMSPKITDIDPPWNLISAINDGLVIFPDELTKSEILQQLSQVEDINYIYQHHLVCCLILAFGYIDYYNTYFTLMKLQ